MGVTEYSEPFAVNNNDETNSVKISMRKIGLDNGQLNLKEKAFSSKEAHYFDGSKEYTVGIDVRAYNLTKKKI